MNIIDVQGKDAIRFLRFQNTAKAIGRDILKTQLHKPDEWNADSINGKDILSVLG